MEYRTNKRTGDRISVIGLGTSYIAETEEKEAVRALEYAYENGINYADLATADAKTFIYYGKAFSSVRKNLFYQVHFGANYESGAYGWTMNVETIRRFTTLPSLHSPVWTPMPVERRTRCPAKQTSISIAPLVVFDALLRRSKTNFTFGVAYIPNDFKKLELFVSWLEKVVPFSRKWYTWYQKCTKSTSNVPTHTNATATRLIIECVS